MSFFRVDLKTARTTDLLMMFNSAGCFLEALNDTADAVITNGHPDAPAVHRAAMIELVREIDRRIPVPT